jgi:hypothetical protein
MTVSSNDIANESLQLIGNNMPPVVGQAPNFDNSSAGVALQKLYTPCVQTVARQWGWDFARNTVALTLTGNSPADPSWLYEYAYPTSGVEVWQLIPATLPDPNNPLPVNWSVGNTQVAGAQTKVIWTNLQNAKANYNNAPTEGTWDPLFREAVVRLLASELAMATMGRPDTAQALLESGAAFESIGEGRPD